MLMQRGQEMSAYFAGHIEQRKTTSDRRSDLDADEGQGQGRSAAATIHVLGSLRLLLDRRHRHHLERDRLLAVASGEHARGPRSPDRGAGTDAERDRGIPARLFAGDDGARGDEGNHHQRLPGQARQHGAAVVPRRQPRSRRCSRMPTRW